MTEGLVTRIGRWIDNKWESKATESACQYRFNSLENSQIQDKLQLQANIDKVLGAVAIDFAQIRKEMAELKTRIDASVTAIQSISMTEIASPKDLADLKTRIEKLELYSGMSRKVDPTKPPVVKSAFSM